MMELHNRTFLITGGASGLGLATAKLLLSKGANVAIVDIAEPADLQGDEHLTTIIADVSNEDEVQNSLNLVLEKYNQIDGLINCAGIGPARRVVGKNGPHELDFFQKVIDINLVGTFNVIRLAVNNMQHNKPGVDGERGVVINTASVAAYDGQIGQAAYAASKGGIVAMTLPLAREFARMGIRVVSIAPGIFETPLVRALPQDAQDSLATQIPFPPRLGNPNEFAALVLHIIRNKMLNAEVIRLDGGIRMGAK